MMLYKYTLLPHFNMLRVYFKVLLKNIYENNVYMFRYTYIVKFNLEFLFRYVIIIHR